MLLQITAPCYCAGVVIEDDVVIRAAPILRWSLGKSYQFLENYFQRKGFKVEVIDEYNP